MFTRKNIQFYSGTDCKDYCSGWIYKIKNSEKLPCIILAHGFAGTKEMRLNDFAEKFASSGYNAFVFDYRHFGDSEGHPRQLLSIKKQHEDWLAAIKYVKTLSYVDNSKIILWGSSFSGGHVLMIGAQNPDIAAIISQVPYMNSIKTVLVSGFMNNLRLFFAALRDTIHQWLHLDPFYVPVLGEPGELAAINGPGEAEIAKKLSPEGYQFDNRVSARVFLSIANYNPGYMAKKIKIPWLVQISSCDRTTPSEPAIKAANNAYNAHLISYEYSHFEFYLEPAFKNVVGDQIKFLQKHV